MLSSCGIFLFGGGCFPPFLCILGSGPRKQSRLTPAGRPLSRSTRVCPALTCTLDQDRPSTGDTPAFVPLLRARPSPPCPALAALACVGLTIPSSAQIVWRRPTGSCPAWSMTGCRREQPRGSTRLRVSAHARPHCPATLPHTALARPLCLVTLPGPGA